MKTSRLDLEGVDVKVVSMSRSGTYMSRVFIKALRERPVCRRAMREFVASAGRYPDLEIAIGQRRQIAGQVE